MIFTERTIRVTNGQSQIDVPVILYRGDKNIKLRFRIVDSPYTYSKTVDNIIETTEAPYAQLVIQTPNDNPPIFSNIVATENGYVTFIITGEMIDEIPEVGSYTFQIRLLDDEQRSRITIPEVVNGVEVREPIAVEGASTTNEVDKAMADYAVVTAAEVEDAFDSNGNYNETTWGNGDVITTGKLNKIEDGITGVNQKIKSVSTYTHPATHPASMITGLSTVATTGNYNDLTNKPTIPTIPASLPANGGNADTVNHFSIWQGTQAQYDSISSKNANTIYLIKEG